jgi:hypothetical protein
MRRYARPGIDTLLLTSGLLSLGNGIPFNILAKVEVIRKEVERELSVAPVEESF